MKPNAEMNEITPKMIEAAADVIQGRAGDEWTTIDWAMSIAEAALEAAFDAKMEPRSIVPIPISPKIDKKIRKLMIALGFDPDGPPAPDWNNI